MLPKKVLSALQSVSYRSFSGFIFWTWNHVTFYVTFFETFDYIIVTIRLSNFGNITLKGCARVCRWVLRGRGFKFQPQCHPIFLWVWRKSWWIVLVQMCPFLTVYGYEKYYMTVNIIDMELIMDSLEINSGVSNRPNAKLGIIVR